MPMKSRKIILLKFNKTAFFLYNDHKSAMRFVLYNIFSSSSAICSCLFQKLLLTLRIKNPPNKIKQETET